MNITLGMQWTLDQINAVAKGGLWPTCAIFVTWDDWGGWFDHVDPTNVESWNDSSQFRYGSRVACLAVSPFAKTGHISKVQYSHVSLIKFCERIFKLPTINKRDANTNDMSDCFDFGREPISAL